MVLRPIYLAHQFSFHSLGEDYHALLRMNRFDSAGPKIEVRREVEASAYAGPNGEGFIDTPRSNRRHISSFDESLASAISVDLDAPRTSQTPIPMLPNGRPRSFRNSAPIRTMTSGISDGVSDSFGRIRREIHKVRSPRILPHPDNGPVSLEFLEEDEDFLTTHVGSSRSHSRGDEDSGASASASASISTPSTGAVPLGEHDDADEWQDWTPEDRRAMDEREQFDDVVGFLEVEVIPQPPVTEKLKRRKRK